MSRPLPEPSVPLTQSKHGYGINQLQRRPSAASVFSDFGAGSQEPFLPEFCDSTNSDTSAGVAWNFNNASFGGGYITHTNPLFAVDGDYFSFMVLLAPVGSIWSFRYLYWTGPAYGILKMDLASLTYQPADRPSGCPAGKIQPNSGGYGDTITYLNTGFNQDCYSPAEGMVTGGYGDYQVIVGGQVGDPLTDLTDVGNSCADGAGLDPQTSVAIMDGGPGWYRTKLHIDGKNGSSSGYRFRVSRVCWSRVDDNLAI